MSVEPKASADLHCLTGKGVRTYTTQMINPAWFVVGCALLVACGPGPVSTVRMGGVFPARPASCELELRMGTLTMELTSSYDTVGVVMVRGEDGEAPNAPRLLKLLKPEACGLGGEVVLVNTSANVQNAQTGSTSSSHSYMVLRKKSTEPVAPQTF